MDNFKFYHNCEFIEIVKNEEKLTASWMETHTSFNAKNSILVYSSKNSVISINRPKSAGNFFEETDFLVTSY